MTQCINSRALTHDGRMKWFSTIHEIYNNNNNNNGGGGDFVCVLMWLTLLLYKTNS